MTEPSQYFKGRTVQEQMNEVIGYVDVRAEEVAAAKADDVLEPAEAAKTAAQAAQAAAEDAQDAAEAARDTTLAALPQIQQDITDLKAEDVTLDGRLDTVELKVQTAEGNIVTIQGQIVALQTADGQNVKINNINQYAVGLTGNQTSSGEKTWAGNQIYNRKLVVIRTGTDVTIIPSSAFNTLVKEIYDGNSHMTASEFVTKNTNGSTWNVRNYFHYYKDESDVVHTVRVGVYYTIENSQTTITLKRVINIFLDGTSVSSETEYTKTVTI